MMTLLACLLFILSLQNVFIQPTFERTNSERSNKNESLSCRHKFT